MAWVIGFGFLLAAAIVAIVADQFLSASAALFIGFGVGTFFGVSVQRRQPMTPKPYDPDRHTPEANAAIQAWIAREHEGGNL